MLPQRLLQQIMYSFARTVNPTVTSKTNNTFKANKASKANNTVLNPAITQQQTTIIVQRDKYRHRHKSGPQLEVARILIVNGPLTSRQIWRSYIRNNQQKQQNNQQFEDYFKSLSQLKKTLGFMRTNGKIRSNGYDRKRKQFRGWKVNEQRSLKYVHPQVIEQVHRQIQSKDEL